MGSVKGSLLGLALLLSAGLAAQAHADQVDVTSQLNQDVAGADQTLTLTVNITIHGNGDIEKLQFPQSPHFKGSDARRASSRASRSGRRGWTCRAAPSTASAFSPATPANSIWLPRWRS